MLKRDPEDVLDIYFQQCSLLVNSRDLAIMAATLANRGRSGPKRVRPAAEHAILDRSGRAVRIIEAQGDLFFISAERLVHRIGEISAEASHIIGHLEKYPPMV